MRRSSSTASSSACWVFARISPWLAHELIEIGAALGLILGVITAPLARRASDSRRREAETRLAGR